MTMLDIRRKRASPKLNSSKNTSNMSQVLSSALEPSQQPGKVFSTSQKKDEIIGKVIGGPVPLEIREESEISDIWNLMEKGGRMDDNDDDNDSDELYLTLRTPQKTEPTKDQNDRGGEYSWTGYDHILNSDAKANTSPSSIRTNIYAFLNLYTCNSFLCCEEHLEKKTPAIVLLLNPILQTFELLRCDIDLQQSLVQDILTEVMTKKKEKQNKIQLRYRFKGVRVAVLDQWQEHKQSNELQQQVNEECDIQERNDIQWPDLSCMTSWHNTYDGLVNRWPRGNIMINCIRLRKYDVRPYEVFIAKPTGMSKIECCELANPVLCHLLQTGVICRTNEHKISEDDSCNILYSKQNEQRDTIITLSKPYR